MYQYRYIALPMLDADRIRRERDEDGYQDGAEVKDMDRTYMNDVEGNHTCWMIFYYQRW